MSEVYAAPSAELTTSEASASYDGIGRLAYFLRSVALQVVSGFALGTLAALEASDFGIGAVVGYFLMLAGMFYIAVLRLRNQGASSWWALGLGVPLLNIYVGLRLLAYPEGYADHRTFDTPAKVIIGLFLAVVLISIAVAVFVPVFASMNP